MAARPPANGEKVDSFFARFVQYSILLELELRIRCPRQTSVFRMGVLPGFVFTPPIREDLTTSRTLHFHQGHQGIMDNRVLQIWFVCLPRSMPQWKIKEDSARRVNRLGNIQSAAHTYGRDPRDFCLPSNQSHGLVTYGSDRN